MRRLACNGVHLVPATSSTSMTAPTRATTTASNCRTSQPYGETAMASLPKIAPDEIPRDGDRRHLTVLVTDEDGHPVHSVSLTYTGLWLLR